jgi:hypothetical protein
MPITATEPGISFKFIFPESLTEGRISCQRNLEVQQSTVSHIKTSTRLHLDIGPQRAQRKAALLHCLHCEDMSLEMHRTSRSGRRARSAKRPFCRRAKAGSWVQLEATLLLAMRASSHDFTPAAVTASTSAPVSNPSLPAALSACMRTP